MAKLSNEAKEKIKVELLKTGEAVSKEAAELIFTLIEIIVKDTENKIDDLVLTFLPTIKEYVMQLLDDISENKE